MVAVLDLSIVLHNLFQLIMLFPVIMELHMLKCF